MNKAVIGTLAVLALVAGGAGTALAHGINAGADAKAGLSLQREDLPALEAGGEANAGFRASLGKLFHFDRSDNKGRGSEERNHKALVGTAEVTGIDGDVIVAVDRDGMTWNIDTDADTKFVLRGDKDAELADIAVGDRIGFTGTVTSSDDGERTVDARLVSNWMIGKDAKAVRRAAGTVESVNAASGTIVLDTRNRGDVTVAIDGDTEIRTEDGDDDGVFADIVVGAKVAVKGILDSFADIMTATKVRIMESS